MIGLLAAGSLLFLAGALLIFGLRSPEKLVQPKIAVQERGIPKNAFQRPQESYQQIKEPFVSLQFAAPNLPLPDLRNILTYYGTNRRPDADPAQRLLFLTLGDAKQIFSAVAGQPVYLQVGHGKYALSPNNAETALWLTAAPTGSGALINLRMKGVDGELISEPKERATFPLIEKPLTTAATPWTLGDWRVDGALFARQKAKWVGPDLFLEAHGGNDYQAMQGKQRIDFGEGEDLYSVFAEPKDVLIWKDNRWQQAVPGLKTRPYPLVEFKNITDRILTSELWDREGKTKITLNLLRTQEPMQQVDLSKDFQFMGARTRLHFMFNVDKKREIVGPEDWFLQTPEGWRKLTKVSDIDAYVHREITGPLLVIDSLNTDQKQKVLRATLYNSLRSEAVPIELPLTTRELKKEVPPQNEETQQQTPVMTPPQPQD